MASTNCLAAVIKRENVERAQGRERIIVKTNVRFFFFISGPMQIYRYPNGGKANRSIDRSVVHRNHRSGP